MDVSGASCEQQEAARVLLQTVGRVLGPAIAVGPRSLSLSSSFFDLGGNSLNSVLTVTSLADLGYNVGMFCAFDIFCTVHIKHKEIYHSVLYILTENFAPESP